MTSPSMWLRIAVGALCLFSISLSPAPTRAEVPAVTSSARRLFDEGLKHVDAQEWAEAETSFRQAIALRDSPVIRFNLAVTLIELQRLIEASTLLHSVDSDPGAPPDVRAKLPDLLETVERRTAKLTLRLDGPTDDAAIALDQRTLAPEELGRAQAVDPREHLVRLLHRGEELEVRRIVLSEGEERLLVLELPASALPPVVLPVAQTAAISDKAALTLAPAQPGSEHDDSDEKTRRRRRIWGIGGAAVALAAGVIVGVVLATRSRNTTPSYDGDFNPKVIDVRVPQ